MRLVIKCCLFVGLGYILTQWAGIERETSQLLVMLCLLLAIFVIPDLEDIRDRVCRKDKEEK